LQVILYVQTKKINSQFLFKLVQKHHKNERKVYIFLGSLPPEPIFRLYYSTLVFNARRKYLQCLLQFHIKSMSFPTKLQGDYIRFSTCWKKFQIMRI